MVGPAHRSGLVLSLRGSCSGLLGGWTQSCLVRWADGSTSHGISDTFPFSLYWERSQEDTSVARRLRPRVSLRLCRLNPCRKGHPFAHGVTTNRELSLRPKTSGKYVSAACAGATKKSPGAVARA